MASTKITDYLAQGLAAARPAIPANYTGTISWYYATDTGALTYYANGTWNSISTRPKLACPMSTLTLSNSQNFGSRGTIMTPSVAVTITDMFAMMTLVSGGHYQLGVAPWNTGTSKITGAPTYTAPIIAGSSGIASINGALSAPLTLTPGTAYVFFVVRTDVVGTTAMDVSFAGSNAQAPGFVPNTSNNCVKLASNGPTTSDTWSTDAAAAYTTLPIYTLP